MCWKGICCVWPERQRWRRQVVQGGVQGDDDEGEERQEQGQGEKEFLVGNNIILGKFARSVLSGRDVFNQVSLLTVFLKFFCHSSWSLRLDIILKSFMYLWHLCSNQNQVSDKTRQAKMLPLYKVYPQTLLYLIHWGFISSIVLFVLQY